MKSGEVVRLPFESTGNIRFANSGKMSFVVAKVIPHNPIKFVSYNLKGRTLKRQARHDAKKATRKAKK